MRAPEVGTVEVRLFGRYRELADGPVLRLEVPRDCTVEELVETLRCRDGGDLPARPFVAVNHRRAAYDARIAEGDEVAIIPPVAGG